MSALRWRVFATDVDPKHPPFIAAHLVDESVFGGMPDCGGARGERDIPLDEYVAIYVLTCTACLRKANQ